MVDVGGFRGESGERERAGRGKGLRRRCEGGGWAWGLRIQETKDTRTPLSSEWEENNQKRRPIALEYSLPFPVQAPWLLIENWVIKGCFRHTGVGSARDWKKRGIRGEGGLVGFTAGVGLHEVDLKGRRRVW